MPWKKPTLKDNDSKRKYLHCVRLPLYYLAPVPTTPDPPPLSTSSTREHTCLFFFFCFRFVLGISAFDFTAVFFFFLFCFGFFFTHHSPWQTTMLQWQNEIGNINERRQLINIREAGRDGGWGGESVICFIYSATRWNQKVSRLKIFDEDMYETATYVIEW